VNNLGSGSDEGVFQVEFLRCDFGCRQAPHILGALMAFDQPNVQWLIHRRQSVGGASAHNDKRLASATAFP
jgi:hypothetical protein